MGSDTLPMIDVHEAEKKGLVKAEKTVYTFLSDNCQKTGHQIRHALFPRLCPKTARNSWEVRCYEKRRS